MMVAGSGLSTWTRTTPGAPSFGSGGPRLGRGHGDGRAPVAGPRRPRLRVGLGRVLALLDVGHLGPGDHAGLGLPDLDDLHARARLGRDDGPADRPAVLERHLVLPGIRRAGAAGAEEKAEREESRGESPEAEARDPSLHRTARLARTIRTVKDEGGRGCPWHRRADGRTSAARAPTRRAPAVPSSLGGDS